ncbi:predicted protein [Phaeodactylum tricornutum CCAP 1055/1]|jgi:hypothetical protein|uniref:Uncharacterized protein n=1 Tax=Phaeodactylum tricornutum (strain CCAP 1055/1) TaxID=556484 RepID=B7FTE5_PHATC|nr:predicted protein [Phaeodactylum tricornutum CCAP 1055/1]EEC50642.1 predicted protein [Phaeodactylum tricornutum CCAP 1055/1]|eukprot:XP_002177828.1 predicted protein [Phaeodactylum tricornutum CCAP 1055/1]
MNNISADKHLLEVSYIHGGEEEEGDGGGGGGGGELLKAEERKTTGLYVPLRHALVCVTTILLGGMLMVGALRSLANVPTLQLHSSTSAVKKHIPPIKPLHHGHILYLTTSTDDEGRIYRREFTAPCGYGILVFNVGPAAEYEPFTYDVYEDAYVYSNNQGLCFIQPSYKGVQTGDAPFWEPTDPTEMNVPLGDEPIKISTRVVIEPGSKAMDPRLGGDFIIISKGNFYNPEYYKQLKAYVHSWENEDITTTSILTGEQLL